METMKPRDRVRASIERKPFDRLPIKHLAVHEVDAMLYRHFGVNTLDALLVYAAPRPSLMAPSGGYTFSWTGLMGAGAMGGRISRFRMPHLKSDRVEMEMAFDHQLVSADLGYYFDDVTAA